MQMLRAMSAIATGGLLTTPHVLLRAEGGGGGDSEMACAPDSHRRRECAPDTARDVGKRQ